MVCQAKCWACILIFKGHVAWRIPPLVVEVQQWTNLDPPPRPGSPGSVDQSRNQRPRIQLCPLGYFSHKTYEFLPFFSPHFGHFPSSDGLHCCWPGPRFGCKVLSSWVKGRRMFFLGPLALAEEEEEDREGREKIVGNGLGGSESALFCHLENSRSAVSL